MSWHNLASDVTHLCDVINTQQVLKRIEELEDEYRDDETGEPSPLREVWSVDDWDEHASLSQLIADVRNDANESVENGVTLIRETYFADYIKEFYTDCGSEFYESTRDGHGYVRVPWDELMSRTPFNHIDWAAVAEDERSGYSEFDYDGITYYYL